MKRFLRAFGLATLLILAFPASALGMGGMYTAKYVDGSTVIILANNVHNTQANVPITYNLRCYDLEGRPIYFGNVQLDIMKGSRSIEQRNLRRTIHGDTSTTISFSKQGTYKLKVSFLDNDKKIAEGEFPIVAAKGPGQNWFTAVATWQTGIGFVVGALGATLIGRYPILRKKTKHVLPKTIK